jgi:sucrose 6(F)-phosphate phosphorylase
VRIAPQLMTYADSLGGDLAALEGLLNGPLSGLFGGLHILPPFPSSGDRGFAPMTYDEIEPAVGSWDDIERIAASRDVLLDVMINHVSRRSPAFEDFLRFGRKSRFADLFITLDKVWPNGEPPASDVARIFLRKPDAPFSTVTIESTGEQERIWTSFGTKDWSEQIDVDVTSAQTRELITDWLRAFAGHGVRIVRLDAVGYVIKKAGTSCFMVEPEIYAFLDWIVGVANSLGLVLLPEVHDQYATHQALARHGYWTYDFVLPGLLLHAFATGSARRLGEHLGRSPERQFTMLDCHDGIPVRPDLDGILSQGEMLDLADLVQRRGGNVNRILSDAHAAGDVDVHQLNCTYYAALDCHDDRYVAARAIQLFARGVPQVYYVGLLAGENDHAAVAESGEGRAINRRNYSTEEATAALEQKVVQRVLDLVRLRMADPAFGGSLDVSSPSASSVRMTWTLGDDCCELEADLASGRSLIKTRHDGVEVQFAP